METQVIARHAPLAPGEYLRLRRQAAGLSPADVAAAMNAIGTGGSAQVIKTMLDRAESGHAGAFAVLEHALPRIVPMDRQIAWQLFAIAADPESDLPVPDVCTGCGCSWHLPCDTDLGPCAWREGTASRCTACPPERA